MHNRDENKLKKNQFDKEKRGLDGKQEKQFLTTWPGKWESWIGADNFAICSGPKVA